MCRVAKYVKKSFEKTVLLCKDNSNTIFHFIFQLAVFIRVPMYPIIFSERTMGRFLRTTHIPNRSNDAFWNLEFLKQGKLNSRGKREAARLFASLCYPWTVPM